MGNEWLKKTFMLFFFFFPLEVIFSDIKMRLWWVHSCSALLLLWMREVFYSKAVGQVPGFKPLVCWKASWALEQAVLDCFSLSEQMLLLFCLLPVLSLQIEVMLSTCLAWRCKNHYKKRTGTFWRSEFLMGWKHIVEIYMAPGLSKSAHLPKWRWLEKTESQLNDVTADLGKVISLKELSSSGLCSFSIRKEHKKSQDETKHDPKHISYHLLKALKRCLCC